LRTTLLTRCKCQPSGRLLGRFLVGAGEQVGIDVQQGLGPFADPRGDHVDGDAVGQEVGGVRMSQDVRPVPDGQPGRDPPPGVGYIAVTGTASKSKERDHLTRSFGEVREPVRPGRDYGVAITPDRAPGESTVARSNGRGVDAPQAAVWRESARRSAKQAASGAHFFVRAARTRRSAQ
jgi:hypothetical protein